MSRIDYGQAFETMIQETESYIKNAGLKSMVLGISGGIDSTVVAAVCHEVSKRNPDITFYGVSLPSSTNSEKENKSAHYALKAFCDVAITANIEDVYKNMEKLCGAEFESTAISRGNIKARIRMIYLYNVAGVNKGLVMDTDNLTEHYLGFFTIHGDQGDFGPIGQLWKTEVYELAQYLKDEYYVDCDYDENIANALEYAINIDPTDGNGVLGSSDLDQIMPGYTYEDVDNILQHIINKDFKITDAKNFLLKNPHITVEAFWKVVDRYISTDYKRKHLPISIDKSELFYELPF